MAKRYARVNWQNRPNVATPISATNLNKMDKGINDIDNAIEEIYNKRVNNVVTTNPDTFLAGPVGKTLQDQVDVLNNKLAWGTAVRATLQNGWSGTINCSKNRIGFIIVYGTQTVGTIAENTVIAQLPSGYEPNFNTPIIIRTASGVFGAYLGAVILTDGRIVVRNPLISNIATGQIVDFSVLYTKI